MGRMKDLYIEYAEQICEELSVGDHVFVPGLAEVQGEIISIDERDELAKVQWVDDVLQRTCSEVFTLYDIATAQEDMIRSMYADHCDAVHSQMEDR